MQRAPRSLAFYVAASTAYALVVFVAMNVVYDLELANAGLLPPPDGPREALVRAVTIHAGSFLVWLVVSLVAAVVAYRFAATLAVTLDRAVRRERDLNLVSEVAAALAGPLRTLEIGVLFLRFVRRAVGEVFTAALFGYDEPIASFRTIAEDGPRRGEFRGTPFPAASLPAEVQARLLEQRAPVVLADTAAPGELWPGLCARFPQLATTRTFGLLPLVSRDRLVGALLLRADRAAALDAHGRDLLTILCQYAAGALHSAVTVADAEHLAKREGIVNRVAQRARATLDPDQIVGATVGELARELGAARAIVALGTSADDLRVTYEWGAPGVEAIRASEERLAVARLAAREGDTIAVSDVARDERVALSEREELRRAGTHAAIATPIALAGKLVGALSFHCASAPREWQGDDVRLLEAVARELRVAMETARLFDARQRENERMHALHRASAALAAQTNPRLILEEVLRNAVGLLGRGSASLFLWDEAAALLRCVQNWQVADQAVSATLAPGQGAAGTAFARLEPFIVNDYPRWEGAIETSLAAGQTAAIAVPLVRTGRALGALVIRAYDPATRFTEEDGRLLALFGDQVVAALAAAEAFEQQRRAVEELERLNRAKSDFVSIVSHEFRTPLTGIQGFSELIRDEDLTLAEIREYAADINKDAQRLGRMITDMLDLDRMESGRMTLHRESVDLNAVIAEVADRVRPTAPSHPISLQLDPELPGLAGDRDKLTQVIGNLLSNAVKYSPAGGEIVISTRREGERAHVFVRDHGMGIPADAVEAVFERYVRVESQATRSIRGTGLGLPIVRQIVELHGGRVWVESTLGEGSAFQFTLPLAASTAGV